MRRHQLPVLLALLIAYGSLYPFHFVAPASFHAAWTTFIGNRRLWTSLGDEVGNVALFVPLGVVIALSMRPERFDWRAASAYFAACVALSFATQVAQIYFPPRDAELADVVSNSVGALLGIGAGGMARRFVRLHLPGSQESPWLVFVLLAVWIVGDLWPLVPSIDWGAWKESLKPIFIAPHLSWTSVLFHAVAVYFVCELIRFAVPRAKVEPLALLAMIAVLFGKVIVVGQTVQPSFVLGTMLGLLTMRVLGRIGPARLPVLLALLFTVYTVRSVFPLVLRDSPAPISWVPFASYLDGDMDINAQSLTNSAYFFLGIPWLVARMHGRVVPFSAGFAVWVGIIEFIQRWIVGHTADVTQPILAIAAGVAVQLLSTGRWAASRKPLPIAQ